MYIIYIHVWLLYIYIYICTHTYIYIYNYMCVCAIWISLHSFQVEVNWPLGARSAPETRSRSDTWRSFGLDWDLKMHQLTSHDFYSQYLWDNCDIIVGSWDLCGIWNNGSYELQICSPEHVARIHRKSMPLLWAAWNLHDSGRNC